MCDKVVCERWCATKKMVYVTKFLCERSCMCVCVKVVCERWCVAKEQCAGSQDAVQRHQSMSLTAVTAQGEKFIAG